MVYSYSNENERLYTIPWMNLTYRYVEGKKPDPSLHPSPPPKY